MDSTERQVTDFLSCRMSFMQHGSHHLEYREAGPHPGRAAHWWFLPSLIAVGVMILLLRRLEPGQDRPECDISNYLSDRDTLRVRIAVDSLALVWCGLLVAFFTSLRRLRSAA